ncbi:uncharacterized protein [Dermacentor albipictus]|uniref:uncharacterized protein n=1 Tax=Dermacentor albipictus TaxID=60249 RepID=UPI0031FC748D
MFNQVFTNLRHLVNILSHCRLDNDKSGAASMADGCILLDELSVWNGFRSIVNIELRELRPSRPSLVSLCGRVLGVSSNVRRRCSLVLVYWLPMEHPSTDLFELCASGILPNQLSMRDGVELSGNLRHDQISYCQWVDYPPRELIDALRSTVTPLYMLEILSVYFSSVGVHMLCELFVTCEALYTLAFLENRIDVPKAKVLMRCCATHNGMRKVYINELFATVDSCYVPDDLVRRTAVIDQLVVSHRVRCTYGKPHAFAAFFVAVADRCALIKTFQIYNLKLYQVDLRDVSRVLKGSATMERPNFTCTAAAAGLQCSLALVILRKVTPAEIHVSSCLAPLDNLGEITKVIGGDEMLKKLSFSQTYRSGYATWRLVGTLKVNLTQGFVSLGTIKQPVVVNFSKQVCVRDNTRRAEFEGFCAFIDSLVAYYQKTWQATFETSVPLYWPQFKKHTRRLCGNGCLTRFRQLWLPAGHAAGARPGDVAVYDGA